MSSTAIPMRHRFDVEAYHRLGEAGVLAPEARVELIEGDIVEMAPIGWRHSSTINRLNKLLVLAAGDRAVVAVQNPVRLSRFSEPQPDFALLTPDHVRQQRHPEPADTFLVVEVAESSLGFDRGAKADLYARSGILECWVVDLVNECVEVLRSPQDGRFTERIVLGRGDTASPRALPGLAITVSDIFG